MFPLLKAWDGKMYDLVSNSYVQALAFLLTFFGVYYVLFLMPFSRKEVD